MALSKPNPFQMEHCTLVTNNVADINDMRLFIREELEKFFLRGNVCSSRLMILSGTHGDKDGRDGGFRLSFES